jgi:phospholipase/carboxylesterase
VPFVKPMSVRSTHGVRFVLPHAPRRRITLNQQTVMRAWFDIHAVSVEGFQDLAGMQQSAKAIVRLIEQEMALGIPSDRIVLAGFSQGGAMALYSALRFGLPLAGAMCLSGCLPGGAELAQERHASNQKCPIWLGHGYHDQVLAMGFAEHAKKTLTALAYDISWHAYDMGHQVCAQESDDCDRWLASVL